MAKQEIAGGRIGSIKNLKKSLKASGGGPLSWIPKEGVTVRFLTEPDEWFGFYEHYDEAIRKSYPCTEGDCPGCATDQKRTFRYVANVLNIETDKVQALLLPKSLANRLTTRYERNDTLMDRDFELFKEGEGLDTEYDLNPEAPKRRNISKYDLIDLGDALQKTWDSVWGEEDDDDDEEETPRSRQRRTREAARKGRSRSRDEDEDDDDEEEWPEDDEDDEDEDDEETLEIPGTLEELEDLSLDELREVAEELDVSTKPDKGKSRLSKAVMRERIAEELGLDDEDEEEDDDEDDEDFDDEDFEFSEDELESFSMAELREVARDYQIKTAKMKKGALIEAILEAQEE